MRTIEAVVTTMANSAAMESLGVMTDHLLDAMRQLLVELWYIIFECYL